MRLEVLLEMPKYIPDIDWFSLNKDAENLAYFKRATGPEFRYKKKLFDLGDNVSVYQFKSEFFCLDLNKKTVIYYMKYQVDVKPKIGQYVWQSLVWTDVDAHKDYLIGLAEKIFFEYLLPKYHTIATDSEQSWRGKRFWQYRISDAFKKGLNVYFCDFQTRELVKLANYKDLDKYQEKYDIWGETDKHFLKRMVITNKDLI